MNEPAIHFDRLLTDEPPLTLDLAPVVARGRRARRLRRAAYAGYAVTGVAAVTALALVAVPALTPSPSRVVPAGTIGGRQAVPAGLSPAQHAMAKAVIDNSPVGWTFVIGPDRWDRDVSVDAVVDDGTGPGRLNVIAWADISPKARCSDLEAGATCTERALPGGATLSMRQSAPGAEEQYAMASVGHPDGSGVIVTAHDYTITWPIPQVKTEAEKKALFHPTRTRPAYTAEQLADIALAVNDLVR